MNMGDVLDWYTAPGRWSGDAGIPHRIVEHLTLSFASMVVAAAIALPVGLWLGHRGRGGVLVTSIANLGRAIPSYALLLLCWMVFIAWDLPVGAAVAAAFVAMLALALPPMVVNSYTGVRQVDDDVREAARGAGMRGPQLLWHVELPLAAPLVWAGVRTAATNVVATATLAAVVGWGGLGRFVVDALALRDDAGAIASAALVAAVALGVEGVLVLLQRATVSPGLRRSTRERAASTVPLAPTAFATADDASVA